MIKVLFNLPMLIVIGFKLRKLRPVLAEAEHRVQLHSELGCPRCMTSAAGCTDVDGCGKKAAKLARQIVDDEILRLKERARALLK